MKMTYIYGLKLFNSDEIRYIGKSDDPKKRLKRHISDTKYKIKNGLKLTYKEFWLKKNDFKIDYTILELCSYDEWVDKEKFYIELYKNLTNTSSGGLGGSGVKYKMSYEEIKEWVKTNLGVKSKTQWFELVRTNKIPNFISKNPNTSYKGRGWISWGDFLGTGKKWDNYVDYLSYDDAKNLIKNLKIKNSEEYRKSHKNGLIKKDIPFKPDRYYLNRGWISWGDFLGNNFIANQFREYYDYNTFKEKIKELNIKTYNGYLKYIKGCKDDKKLPSTPSMVYKNKGWINWYDVIK